MIGQEGDFVRSVICSREPRIDTFPPVSKGTDTLLCACLAAGRSARGACLFEQGQGQDEEARLQQYC